MLLAFGVDDMTRNPLTWFVVSYMMLTHLRRLLTSSVGKVSLEERNLRGKESENAGS